MKFVVLVIGLALLFYSLFRIGKAVLTAEMTQFDAGNLAGHVLLLIIALILLKVSRRSGLKSN